MTEHQSSKLAPDQPRPAIGALVLIAAVTALAINLFVPSMPSIAADLNAPYSTIQLGLSLYLICTAALQLVAGPVSDRYGRRPVLLAGILIFIIGTFLCIMATSPIVFLIGRVIQTTSAVGMVLSRAIIRDVYPREKSASMIGYVVMAMAIAPMIGPAIGGYVDVQFGWRASFGLLAAFGFITLTCTWFFIPETNKGAHRPLREQTRIWRDLLSSKLFWLYTASAGLASSVFFAFLGGGPFVSISHFGQTPFEYGIWFALCALGYAVGNFISGRFSEKRGVEKMIAEGAVVATLGPILALALLLVGFDRPWAMFVPLAFVGIGNGMTLPNVTAAAISLRPEAAGAASGLLGALQMATSAIGSIIGGYVVSGTGSPIALVITMGFIAIAGLATALGANYLAARTVLVEAEVPLG